MKLNLICICVAIVAVIALLFSDNHDQVRIREVIHWRTDTIKSIDTLLSVRIKRVQSLPETLVQVEFDTLFRDTGTSKEVITTIYAERRCLEVTDSLTACQQKIAVDDVAFARIDTLVKVEPAPLKQRLLDVGAGILVGLGLRSLY